MGWDQKHPPAYPQALHDKRSAKETIEVSYYISSVEDSKRVFRAIRDHWKIENQLHYMLDVYLGEDG